MKKFEKKFIENRRNYTIFRCNLHCGPNICSNVAQRFQSHRDRNLFPNSTANLKVGLLADFRWNVQPHSPYSPDAAWMTTTSSHTKKKELGGRRFENKKLIIVVWEISSNLGRDFYCDGIEKLVPRLNKCLDRNGDYIEK